MIVVDTNVIAYFWLPGKYTEKVKKLYNKDPVWAAPFLWRSEFRNILALYIRKELLNKSTAFEIISNAENMMKGNEYSPNSLNIIDKIDLSSVSAYDLEFVTLAESLETKLYTFDKQILKHFPKITLGIK